MRASKFLLLGLLALFSTSSFAYTKHYDSSGSAEAACNAREAQSESVTDNPGKNCYLSAGDSSAGVWYYGIDLHAWLLSGCSAGTYSGEAGQCFPTPTDEECAGGDSIKNGRDTYSSADEMNTTDTEAVKEFGGCLYAVSGSPTCFFTGVVSGQIACDFEFNNLGISIGDTAAT